MNVGQRENLRTHYRRTIFHPTGTAVLFHHPNVAQITPDRTPRTRAREDLPCRACPDDRRHRPRTPSEHRVLTPIGDIGLQRLIEAFAAADDRNNRRNYISEPPDCGSEVESAIRKDARDLKKGHLRYDRGLMWFIYHNWASNDGKVTGFIVQLLYWEHADRAVRTRRVVEVGGSERRRRERRGGRGGRTWPRRGWKSSVAWLWSQNARGGIMRRPYTTARVRLNKQEIPRGRILPTFHRAAVAERPEDCDIS